MTESKWKCPENMRECPHGWNDCNLCANFNLCINGLYRPFEEPIVIAAEIAEKSVSEGAKESAEKIKGMQEDYDWWGWWGRSSPPSLHTKEALPLDGPSAPGGGSNSKRHKKPTKKQPEYLKTWGT